MQYIPPNTPLLHSKTGVCRGIPIFLIFAPKHRLWVLIRTASPRWFYYVLSKNKKNNKNSAENFQFLKLKKSLDEIIPTCEKLFSNGFFYLVAYINFTSVC